MKPGPKLPKHLLVFILISFCSAWWTGTWPNCWLMLTNANCSKLANWEFNRLMPRKCTKSKLFLQDCKLFIQHVVVWSEGLFVSPQTSVSEDVLISFCKFQPDMFEFTKKLLKKHHMRRWSYACLVIGCVFLWTGNELSGYTHTWFKRSLNIYCLFCYSVDVSASSWWFITHWSQFSRNGPSFCCHEYFLFF